MPEDCIFCKIASRTIEADIVLEDEDVVAFRDVNPQAPVHVLIIPKEHIRTLNDLSDGDRKLISKLLLVAKEVADIEGVADSGYRVVANCNRAAGQEVFHVHLHVLGGRDMTWPPG